MSKAENQKRYINSPKGIAYRKSDAFRESIRKHNRIRDRVHRREIVSKIRAIKIEKGCSQCGYNKHHAALQFHHRDPETKKFGLGNCHNYSWKACLEEIEKCDVLCAICHAILEDSKKPPLLAIDDPMAYRERRKHNIWVKIAVVPSSITE
jgi:hypothetical protein